LVFLPVLALEAVNKIANYAGETTVDEPGETGMTDKDKINLLKDEYLLLQKAYEDLDVRLMTIKGWGATVAITAIGLGFYQNPYLWLFAAGASIVFWYLEATWKVYQYNYGPRIQTLENAFRWKHFNEIAPFQIAKSWWEADERRRERRRQLPFLDTMFKPSVSFPHVVTASVSVVLFVLEWQGVLHIPRPT
jgi:hypothetical protein